MPASHCAENRSLSLEKQQLQQRSAQSSGADDDGLTGDFPSPDDFLSEHGMATKKTEIFLRLSTMFPTVEPDLVTMLLDDFAWFVCLVNVFSVLARSFIHGLFNRGVRGSESSTRYCACTGIVLYCIL